MDIQEAAKAAKAASIPLAATETAIKNKALRAIGKALSEKKQAVLEANEKDLALSLENNLAAPLLKRLKFDEEKLAEVISGIESLVGLPDPVKAWMERRPAPSIFDVLGNSLRIMEAQISATRLEIDRPDLLIRPEVGDVSFMEFFRAEEMIAEGYRAAKDALEREGRA